MSVENTSLLERLFAGGAIREMPRRSRRQRRRRRYRVGFIFTDLRNIFAFLRAAQAGRGGARD